MKKHLCELIAAAAATLSAAFAQSAATDPAGGGTALAAIEKQMAPKGATPRTADGKPDFSGMWSPERTFIYDISSSLAKGEALPLQPWAEKLAQERMSKDDPEANCLPTGVPRQAPYPWRIVQSPGLIFFLFEGNIHSYRQIFIDGRQHTPEANRWPTWYGDSVGSWEGDTLVVDTVGFNDRFWFDAKGHPHTDQLHTIERYTRKDLGTLVAETTIIDPGSYTKPFKVGYTARYALKDDLMEYICAENNQDVTHITTPTP
jgi:hypothetical protein